MGPAGRGWVLPEKQSWDPGVLWHLGHCLQGQGGVDHVSEAREQNSGRARDPVSDLSWNLEMHRWPWSLPASPIRAPRLRHQGSEDHGGAGVSQRWKTLLRISVKWIMFDHGVSVWQSSRHSAWAGHRKARKCVILTQNWGWVMTRDSFNFTPSAKIKFIS